MSDFSLISDLYKDVYGFRPSSDWMTWFNGLSWAEQNDTWNSLCRELESDAGEERREKRYAASKFASQIRELMRIGARDRKTAIRWLVDSVCDPEQVEWYGGSYVCHSFHLDYRHSGFFAKVLGTHKG